MQRYSVSIGVLVLFFSVACAQADPVKDLILDHIDPEGTEGMSVYYYAELSGSQQDEFDDNYDNGEGYFIPEIVTETRETTQGWEKDTHQIFIVEIDGDIAVPLNATCHHSGCSGAGCSVEGCHNSTGGDGKPACTGAICAGEPCQGQPICSKTESKDASAFERYNQ